MTILGILEIRSQYGRLRNSDGRPDGAWQLFRADKRRRRLSSRGGTDVARCADAHRRLRPAAEPWAFRGPARTRRRPLPVHAANNDHLDAVVRYVERNALRAGLVEHAEGWRWGSLHQRARKAGAPLLGDWPLPQPSDWPEQVNAANGGRNSGDRPLASAARTAIRFGPSRPRNAWGSNRHCVVAAALAGNGMTLWTAPFTHYMRLAPLSFLIAPLLLLLWVVFQCVAGPNEKAEDNEQGQCIERQENHWPHERRSDR